MTVEQERAIDRRQQGGAIATEAPSNPWASAGLLKPYAGGAVHEAPKVDALATISAGYKNADGFPVVSRDGTIHVRSADRAPGLLAELERRGNRSLTIALVHNDPKDVLQQWFATYSKTRLEQRGDENEIVIIHLRQTGQRDRKGNPVLAPVRETVRRDQNPDRYATLAADMKVQTSLYFALAAWENDEPKLIFPDGLGLYRLHFTSLNSAEAIKSQLSYIASLTGGRVAGVPLELSISYRNLAGPDGVRRDKVPIWSLVLKPPQTIQLNPARIASILQSGINQAQSLAIAAPQRETLALAEYEGSDVDLDEARVIDGEVVVPSQRDVDRLVGGGPIRDPDRFKRLFMMTAKGSSLEDKENRQQFMIAATGGRFDSVKTFAETATHNDGRRLMERQASWLSEEASVRQAEGAAGAQLRPADKPLRRFEEIFGDDDEGPTPASEQPKVAPTTSTPQVMQAAALTGAPSVAPPDPPRPESDRAYTRAQWGAMYVAWAPILARLDSTFKPVDVETLANGSLKAAVMDVLGQVDNARAALAAYAATDPGDEGFATLLDPDGSYEDDQAAD